MSTQPSFSAGLKSLNQARQAFMLAQIEDESGLAGKTRKLGLTTSRPPALSRKYAQARSNYYRALTAYRAEFLALQNHRHQPLTRRDVSELAQQTLFAEIERFRQEKEMLFRQQGLNGILRTQLQEWRELKPSFKIGFGFFFIFLGLVTTIIFHFLQSPGQLDWLKALLIAWGTMVFAEGSQQKISQQRARRQKISWTQIFQKTRRNLVADRTYENQSELLHALDEAHRQLNNEIQRIRIFEKRAEVLRYVLAGLLGAATLVIWFFADGIKTIITSFIAAASARLALLSLPFTSIRQSFSSWFEVQTAEAFALFRGRQNGEETDQTASEPPVPLNAELQKLTSQANPEDPQTYKPLIDAVAQKAEVPAPILWGMLKQESQLGQNNGHGSYRVDMHPAQRKVFEEICENLGLNPAEVGVSARPANYSGWGGAMGPSQFIPTTWKLYEDKVADLLETDQPNPWELPHALTAMALKLKEDGVNLPGKEQEAIGRYFAGGNWSSPAARRYVQGVLNKASDF